MPSTLQSFKLLATRCATTTATQSPTASPVVLRRRRRKTLRMFLHDPPETADKDIRVRSKLKDLLLSSPPPPPMIKKRQEREGLLPGGGGGGFGFRLRSGSGFRRGGAASLRLRLLRRAWRPVLQSIPE
ncbi:hypothetical protein GLYMA_19G050700v4 [Glycine max]|uniref:Uncharacterized protein n=1 Tax=Glycine max TaxID=3847 RepID=K7MWN6_SOYBN|nr:uncharacterized protein LOC102670217 [Glycine max]KAG4926773.1 hypothetical protein JHK85_053259 [Glycine max]KAH1193058.1 hypothetical protein GmHk_19G054173 [Glycine max]KRG93936.1 hypothetical protein GLYMA_19G050700v4 [Glycine max]|eukprot:XP_006603983.1 uncharacterized protein LOC102670217 [Glycine max]